MMVANIVYHSDAIAAFYSNHRRSWQQLYPSEQRIFEQIAERRGGEFGRVLDVGCACGGLAAALAERYRVAEYTGIDINPQAIALARQSRDISVPHRFIEGDIAAYGGLPETSFDTVVSLGAADWNIDFVGNIVNAWRRVKPGGWLVLSLRLTERESALRIEASYQFVHFNDRAEVPRDAERAPYIVLNVVEALALVCSLDVASVIGYGYWGRPSTNARTPFERVAFTVFALEKSPTRGIDPPLLQLMLPSDLWGARWRELYAEVGDGVRG